MGQGRSRNSSHPVKSSQRNANTSYNNFFSISNQPKQALKGIFVTATDLDVKCNWPGHENRHGIGWYETVWYGMEWYGGVFVIWPRHFCDCAEICIIPSKQAISLGGAGAAMEIGSGIRN